MGMGIHGEPGIRRDKLKPADAIVDEMIDRLLADMPAGRASGSRSWSTRLGATPPEELYIIYRRVRARLAGSASRSSCRSSAATPPRWR